MAYYAKAYLMKKLDEISALQIVFGNIRRKKRKENLVTIAKAFEYLVKHYGSQKAVAEKVGISAEMIRQFLSVLKLPAEVQKLFKNREIDSVDAAKELAVLKGRNKQIRMARKIAGMTSDDARDIKRIFKKGTTTIDEAKRTILQTKEEGLKVFILDFDDDTYKSIMKKARALRKDAAELVREIVIDWLGNET
ncbi:hypothetical protein ES703_84814 [subsurface metagenome]